jgi:hypothetical protein
MAYTTQDFLDDYDVRTQDIPFERDRGGTSMEYEVIIYNDCTGRELVGNVWAEGYDFLRDDLLEIMSDCEAIENIALIV